MKRLISRTVKKISFFLAVSFFSLIISQYLNISISKVSAAELSLGIYPPIIQIQLDPPATISAPITIHNYSEETVALGIIFKPFVSGKGESGEVVYRSGKNPLVFENIKVRNNDNDEAIEKVVIAPKQNKTLNLHLDIPDDSTISDHYFSVVFISENEFKERLNQSKIQGGIATNVLLSIGRKEKSMGKIVEFSTPQFLEIGPVPFTVRLKNESKHFITSQGTISIKNMFGKTIGQVKLSPVNILEGSIRSQQTLWQETLLFGLYTATLNINPSDKGPSLIKSISFFVFPFQALSILVIIVWGILLIKNRLKRHRKA